MLSLFNIQHRDEAVGVMCLNSDINYDNLQNTYELDTLRGLRKATALEKEQYKRSNTLLHTFGYRYFTNFYFAVVDIFIIDCLTIFVYTTCR